MTVGGVIGINGPSLSRGSSTVYHSIGTGKGNYGTGTGKLTTEDLRKYEKQQKAKKEADRKIAISKRARENRIKRARDFQERMSDKKRNPGIFPTVRRSISNFINGEPKIPSREESVRLATMYVDEEEAKKRKEERKQFGFENPLHGGKTKKHRNKKNNTKRRR